MSGLSHPTISLILRAALGACALAPAAIGAATLLAPTSAFAQGDDSSTAEARARFREGVTLYDEGKNEAARAKFKQAYALKQHPDVLLNLGWSSLKSGHPQEAEEAFNSYLRDSKDGTPAKRAEAEKGLAEARRASGGTGGGSAPTANPAAGGGGGGGGGGTSGGGNAGGGTSGGSSGAGGGGSSGSGNASPNATPTDTGGMGTPRGGGAKATARTDAPPSADGPEEPVKEPIRIDALLGYTSDNVNVGIGVRGGKVVTAHLYVGGSLVYNFGTSYTIGTVAGTENISTSAFYIGPEVGWEFVLAPNFTLRPYGGLGFGSFNASVSFSNPTLGGNSSQSESRLIFWPGVTALYDIPNSRFMIGGDARLVFVPGTVGYHGGPAFGIFATGGLRF